jgi:hypothetical protein
VIKIDEFSLVLVAFDKELLHKSDFANEKKIPVDDIMDFGCLVLEFMLY